MLVAVLLGALTFGQGLDGLVCADETAAGASMAFEGVEPAPGVDDHADEVCLHGHCHHGSPFAPAGLVETQAPANLGALAYVPGPDRLVRTDPKFELMRPPRA